MGTPLCSEFSTNHEITRRKANRGRDLVTLVRGVPLQGKALTFGALVRAESCGYLIAERCCFLP